MTRELPLSTTDKLSLIGYGYEPTQYRRPTAEGIFADIRAGKQVMFLNGVKYDVWPQETDPPRNEHTLYQPGLWRVGFTERELPHQDGMYPVLGAVPINTPIGEYSQSIFIDMRQAELVMHTRHFEISVFGHGNRYTLAAVFKDNEAAFTPAQLDGAEVPVRFFFEISKCYAVEPGANDAEPALPGMMPRLSQNFTYSGGEFALSMCQRREDQRGTSSIELSVLEGDTTELERLIARSPIHLDRENCWSVPAQISQFRWLDEAINTLLDP